MAHFYASAQGSRGETHRLGGKSSGAIVEVRGWHDGVRITARYDEVKNKYGTKKWSVCWNNLRGRHFNPSGWANYQVI